MSDRRTPPDRSARLEAATDFDRNLVVVAGAGTGKTSLLVERILTALGSGRVEIERIGETFRFGRVEPDTKLSDRRSICQPLPELSTERGFLDDLAAVPLR